MGVVRALTVVLAVVQNRNFVQAGVYPLFPPALRKYLICLVSGNDVQRGIEMRALGCPLDVRALPFGRVWVVPIALRDSAFGARTKEIGRRFAGRKDDGRLGG